MDPGVQSSGVLEADDGDMCRMVSGRVEGDNG